MRPRLTALDHEPASSPANAVFPQHDRVAISLLLDDLRGVRMPVPVLPHGEERPAAPFGQACHEAPTSARA